MTEYSALRIAREMAAQNESGHIKDWIKRKSEKAMTNTLTDRERELVEAAKCVLNLFIATENVGPITMDALSQALRAYDPPKRKYPIPPFSEFAAGKPHFDNPRVGVMVKVNGTELPVYMSNYNAIREALSTEEE